MFHSYLSSSTSFISQTKFVTAKYEKSKARYPSKNIKKESFQKFYRSKVLPLVAIKDSDSSSRYDHVTVPLVTIFTDIDLKRNPKGYLYIANRISKVAKEYLNKVVFVVSDKKSERRLLGHYNLPALEGEEIPHQKIIE